MLIKFFKKFKYKLVGTMDWRIVWTDGGTPSDTTPSEGSWLFYENGFGKRYFKIISKVPDIRTCQHPGYVDAIRWIEGGGVPKHFKIL